MGLASLEKFEASEAKAEKTSQKKLYWKEPKFLFHPHEHARAQRVPAGGKKAYDDVLPRARRCAR